MKKHIQTVSHPCGRLTLESKTDSDPLFTQVNDPSGRLIGNLNALEFYQAVAEFIAALAANGTFGSYDDAAKRRV